MRSGPDSSCDKLPAVATVLLIIELKFRLNGKREEMAVGNKSADVITP
jgi:hypothetical protein